MRKIIDFVLSSFDELKNVSFPDRKQAYITSIGVVLISLIVSIILGIFDFILSRIFKLIF